MLTLLALVGCVAQVSIDDDPDLDGLRDVREVALGSDPAVPDSDGDGYLDGEEADQYTNPVDAEDHPYQAGWPMGACRNEIEGEGFEDGMIAPNFAMLDQFGETVRLHDFCEQAVYIVFAAFW
jgi:hypothetical protein